MWESLWRLFFFLLLFFLHTLSSHVHRNTCPHAFGSASKRKCDCAMEETFHCGIKLPAALFWDGELVNRAGCSCLPFRCFFGFFWLFLFRCWQLFFFFLATFSELEKRSEAKSKEDVESVAWKNQIAPLLQELESVAAGSFWGLFVLKLFQFRFFHLVWTETAPQS